MTILERYIDLIKEKPYEFENSGSIYIEKDINTIRELRKTIIEKLEYYMKVIIIYW